MALTKEEIQASYKHWDDLAARYFAEVSFPEVLTVEKALVVYDSMPLAILFSSSSGWWYMTCAEETPDALIYVSVKLDDPAKDELLAGELDAYSFYKTSAYGGLVKTVLSFNEDDEKISVSQFVEADEIPDSWLPTKDFRF
jgi:hypothetical protein